MRDPRSLRCAEEIVLAEKNTESQKLLNSVLRFCQLCRDCIPVTGLFEACGK